MDQTPTAVGDLEAVEAWADSICGTAETGSGPAPRRSNGGQCPWSVAVCQQPSSCSRAAQRLLRFARDSVFNWELIAQPTESPYTDRTYGDVTGPADDRLPMSI